MEYDIMRVLTLSPKSYSDIYELEKMTQSVCYRITHPENGKMTAEARHYTEDDIEHTIKCMAAITTREALPPQVYCCSYGPLTVTDNHTTTTITLSLNDTVKAELRWTWGVEPTETKITVIGECAWVNTLTAILFYTNNPSIRWDPTDDDTTKKRKILKLMLAGYWLTRKCTRLPIPGFVKIGYGETSLIFELYAYPVYNYNYLLVDRDYNSVIRVDDMTDIQIERVIAVLHYSSYDNVDPNPRKQTESRSYANTVINRAYKAIPKK